MGFFAACRGGKPFSTYLLCRLPPSLLRAVYIKEKWLSMCNSTIKKSLKIQVLEGSIFRYDHQLPAVLAFGIMDFCQ